MNAQDKNSNQAAAEQLEIACWNGILDELLPEIMHATSCDKELFLWEVEMRTSYLRISMGVCQPVLEEQFTLDPHIFLCTQEMN